MERKKRSDQKKCHFLYRTTCTMTNRYYLGMHSADDVNDGYLGSGYILNRSIKKHGRENHTREVIEMFPDRKSLRDGEKRLITEEKLKDPLCMNLRSGGGTSGPRPADVGKKISIALKGKSRRRMSDALFAEVSRRISIALKGNQNAKGWKWTPEYRENFIQMRTGKKINHRFGIKPSEETRRKMSESHRGLRPTPEARKKMSESQRKRWNNHRSALNSGSEKERKE